MSIMFLGDDMWLVEIIKRIIALCKKAECYSAKELLEISRQAKKSENERGMNPPVLSEIMEKIVNAAKAGECDCVAYKAKNEETEKKYEKQIFAIREILKEKGFIVNNMDQYSLYVYWY